MVDDSISALSVREVRKHFLPHPLLSKRKAKWVDSMAGIPGAGKTTYVENMLSSGRFSKGAFLLSPDAVMESLPEYREDYQRLGPVVAFQRWEEPSVKLSYDMLETARKAELDIIIDMGLARPESFTLLQDLKQHDGYRVRIHWLETPIEIALERIKHRARHTPVSMVMQRLKTLAELKTVYMELADEFVEAT